MLSHRAEYLVRDCRDSVPEAYQDCRRQRVGGWPCCLPGTANPAGPTTSRNREILQTGGDSVLRFESRCPGFGLPIRREAGLGPVFRAGVCRHSRQRRAARLQRRRPRRWFQIQIGRELCHSSHGPRPGPGPLESQARSNRPGWHRESFAPSRLEMQPRYWPCESQC